MGFTANANGRSVLIGWIAVSSSATSIYTIEKSKNNRDFIEVLSTQSVNGNMEYLETDMRPWRGVSFYRLKRVDIDGESCYSLPVIVKRSKKMFRKNSLDPWHMRGRKEADLNSPEMKDQEILIVARDTNGTEYYSKVNIISFDGSTYNAIDESNLLDSGIYIVTYSTHDLLVNKVVYIKNIVPPRPKTQTMQSD